MAKDFNIGSSTEAVNLNVTNGDIKSKGTKVSLEGHTHSEYLGKTEKASSASSADKLANARTIGISGGATGTATSFNGSGNISIPVTKVDASKLSGTLDNMNSVLTGFSSNTGYAISAKSIVNLPNSRATWHDRFAFLQNTTIESVEVKAPNGAWSQSNTSAQIKRLFDGKENKALTIVSATEGGKRFVLKDYSLPWSSIQFIEVSFTYANPFPRTKVVIEYSTDNETWNTRHESTISSGTTTYLFPLSATPVADENYIRLSFIKESETDESTIKLSVIKAWTNRKGDQGFGIEYEQPFNWDENRNIFPHTDNARDLGTSSYKWANVYATNFNGKATSADTASIISSSPSSTKALENNCIPSTGRSVGMYNVNSDSTGLKNDGHILGFTWSGTTAYGAQLYIDTDPTYQMALRQRNGSGVWQPWKYIPMSSTAGITVEKSVPSNAVFTDTKDWASITGKPTLSTVATSGSYNDLTNKPTIPTNNNQLTNGAGYQTASQVSTAISNAVKDITSFEYEVVTALPTTGVKGKIYLKAHAHGTGDAYDEYIWTGSSYEKIGNTDIDLSGYQQKCVVFTGTETDIDVDAVAENYRSGSVRYYLYSSAKLLPLVATTIGILYFGTTFTSASGTVVKYTRRRYLSGIPGWDDVITTTLSLDGHAHTASDITDMSAITNEEIDTILAST